MYVCMYVTVSKHRGHEQPTATYMKNAHFDYSRRMVLMWTNLVNHLNLID